MLYFIQSGSRIKIGRGNPFARFRAIYTASPDPCKLMLAINVHDEVGAERKMHEALKQFRANGEWFEVNFKKAFWTLIELDLIPKDELPHLELPILPDTHSGFERWYLATKLADASEENRQYVSDNRALLWERHYQEFEKRKQELGTVGAIIDYGRPMTDEEANACFAGLRRMLNA